MFTCVDEAKSFAKNFDILRAEIKRQDIETEKKFFETAKVGTQIFWRDPIEEPTSKPFLENQREKHPGKLLIEKIFFGIGDHKDRRFIIISNNGKTIMSPLNQNEPASFTPLWFKLDPNAYSIPRGSIK